MVGWPVNCSAHKHTHIKHSFTVHSPLYDEFIIMQQYYVSDRPSCLRYPCLRHRYKFIMFSRIVRVHSRTAMHTEKQCRRFCILFLVRPHTNGESSDEVCVCIDLVTMLARTFRANMWRSHAEQELIICPLQRNSAHITHA